MEIFIYSIIFIIGTFFGSFFTLAVYRIPRKEDILIKHSYCPNCNHKLGFFDLFPVLSYLFLSGKCRYCENKIRPRYLILEVLSGLTFLILAISVKLDIYSVQSIINVVFLLLYSSVLFIISGIDKENIKIEKPVLIFGVVFEVLYIIYQYALENISVYQYVIYLIVLMICRLILTKCIKEKEKRQYLIQISQLSFYIVVFSGIKLYVLSLIIALILTLLLRFKYKNEEIKVPIGLYLTVGNVLVIAISNIILNYI